MKTAKDALDRLCSSAADMPFTYPTREQIFLCRIVGMATFKLYYTHALLDNDQREQVCPVSPAQCPVLALRLLLGETDTVVQHSTLTRERLVKARVSLAEQSKSKLIWNYLPVDVAQAASAKLDRALEA
jgi:hypothetical protein